MRPSTIAFLLLLAITGCAGKQSSEATVDTASIGRGENVYKQSCVACHMKDGLGAPPMNPPVAGTSYVKGENKELILVILKGLGGKPVDGKKYHNVMPSMEFLTDEQIADVLTYVKNSFGNNYGSVTAAEVKTLR